MKILSRLIALLCLVPALESEAQNAFEFKNPPANYRPTPLWFWNDTRITRQGIDTQLPDLRDKCGYGGISILPFGAKFEPRYLTSDYFDLYGYAIQRAGELGLKMALYDEYGFPSGSGGAINGDGVPRFTNRYPSLTLKRLDKIEEEITGGIS